MTRRVRIALSAAALVGILVASIPLVQKLSIDLMQLQYRERVLASDTSIGALSEGFDIPSARFADRLKLRDVAPAELENMTLSDVARRSARPLSEVKRDVADLVIGEQVDDAYGWTVFRSFDTSDGR